MWKPCTMKEILTSSNKEYRLHFLALKNQLFHPTTSSIPSYHLNTTMNNPPQGIPPPAQSSPRSVPLPRVSGVRTLLGMVLIGVILLSIFPFWIKFRVVLVPMVISLILLSILAVLIIRKFKQIKAGEERKVLVSLVQAPGVRAFLFLVLITVIVQFSAGFVVGFFLYLGILVNVILLSILAELTFRKLKQIEVGEERMQLEIQVDEELELSLLRVTKRFTYQELQTATANFTKVLGVGGFGSVYEGTLSDRTRVAVKRLNNWSPERKEFLAEVKTLGSIHHVNLVRLVGFCAENSNQLLVYEYMTNGSLDKWIFAADQGQTALGWERRKNIILNIAKGLAYLHEDCETKIAHLDVKPQNILLDDEFNAKLADFGLARRIDRNQSQVTTQMRGTPGYIAPEWFSGRITERVDVYSFGVVILEVVCGRKHFLPGVEDSVLILKVKKKAEENRLADLVDKRGEDLQQYLDEAVKMIEIAIRCLHFDPNRRPSMSKVLKVLDGLMTMEPIFDYSFLGFFFAEAPSEVVMELSEAEPDLLSGAR